jgi:hypothetical protein
MPWIRRCGQLLRDQTGSICKQAAPESPIDACGAHVAPL